MQPRGTRFAHFLNNSEQQPLVRTALEKPGHEHFGLTSQFQIDQTMSIVGTKALDESTLSASQREELNSLRQIKEPGEFLVPPDSTDWQDETDKQQSRNLNLTLQNSSQFYARSGSNTHRRRATATFKSKPTVEGLVETEEGTTTLSIDQLEDQKFVSNGGRTDEPDSAMLNEESLIRSLFYLQNEQPQRHTVANPRGKVVFKTMQYKCVDALGPNKRIQVDLIDFVENLAENGRGRAAAARDTSSSQTLFRQSQPELLSPRPQGGEPKQRSLIYFQVMTEEGRQVHQSEERPQVGVEEIKGIAASHRFESFDHLYNSVTEKMITRVMEVN